MAYKSIMAPHIAPLFPEPTSLCAGGRLTPPVRAVLFDIYGTLLVSAAGDMQVMVIQGRFDGKLERLLEKYGIQRTTRSLINAYMDAVSAEHARQRQQNIDYPEIRTDQLWMRLLETSDASTAKQFAVEFEMIVNPTWPMPHARETIEILRQQNLLLGLISNAQFYTPHLFDLFFNAPVDALGFDPDLIFFSYMHGHAKPSPVMFSKASGRIREMGLPAASVVFVGNDMKNDMVPARNAGFQTVLFAGDRRSLRQRENDPDCAGVAPDLVITDLAQLPSHLKSLNNKNS
jgi:putative hydrolase of the HAD superfamily